LEVSEVSLRLQDLRHQVHLPCMRSFKSTWYFSSSVAAFQSQAASTGRPAPC
jgi:hypothetical protein